MTHKLITASGIASIALWVLMLFASTNQSHAAIAVQTPDELQQMFNQGLYSEMLRKLNVTLASKTADADKPTRYTLLMLKGEALLRTGASEPASDAFRAASLIGGDDHAIAIARATAALVKRSTVNRYQPKLKASSSSASASPIDILDATSRKLAFSALSSDLLDVAKPLVDSALKMTSLAPIMEVAASLADVRPVEIAATDSDTQSKELLKQLGDHASSLMSEALKKLDAQIVSIGKAAAKRSKQAGTKYRGRATSTNLPQGLSSENAGNLDGIISRAREIGNAAVQMQPTFGDAGNLKTIETDAQKTIDSADKLLKQYKHPAAP